MFTRGRFWLFLLAFAVGAALLAARPGPGSTAAAPAVDEPPPSIELIAQVGGATEAVAVAGDIAFAGVGPRLVAVDVRDPARPRKLGESVPLPDTVRDIALAGRYAYVSTGDGFRVIDTADPTRLTVVGARAVEGGIGGLAVADDLLLVTSPADGLHILSLAAPTAPEEIGFYETSGAAREVAAWGDYALVIDDLELPLPMALIFMSVIDLRNPAAPVEVGFYASPSGFKDVRRITAAGQYAYIANGGAGVEVVDLSNPAAPVLADAVDTAGSARGVAVAGNRAYVADDAGGLRVLDVSDPAAPRELGALPMQANGVAAAAADGRVLVAGGGTGLAVVDGRDPAAPVETGRFETLGAVTGLAALDGRLYTVNGGDTLSVLDVSNPAAPIRLGRARVPGNALGVTAREQTVYVAAGSAGLRVFSALDPAAPVETGACDTTGPALDVAVEGDYAYVAADSAGMRVISVADRAAPAETGSYRGGGRAFGVTARDQLVYVANGGLGFHVVSVADPAAPKALSVKYTLGMARDVTVAGDFAYLATAAMGLRVLNVSNPAQPQEVAALRDYDTFDAVAVVGNHAFGAAREVAVIDVMRPEKPALLAAFPRMAAYDVAAADNIVYAAAGANGLLVLRFPAETPATPTPTVTLTRPPRPTPSITPTPTVTPPLPGGLDLFEPDDTCDAARLIDADGGLQERTFHRAGDTDWVAFPAVAGVTYTIQADPVGDSPADVTLETRDGCGGEALSAQDHAFSPGVRTEVTARATGPLYVRLANHEPGVAGPQVTYAVSVRRLTGAPEVGALVLVAGRRVDEALQANIYAVANHAYEVFTRHGYTADDIMYLAGDGQPGQDGPASLDALEIAIKAWTKGRIGTGKPLTVYLVDHGDDDRFFLNEGAGQVLRPWRLDEWLTFAEYSNAGAQVNVIIEACRSGSFIAPPDSISRPGRVVITSAAAGQNAYASATGAAFSDRFIDSLDLDASLYAAYQNAYWGSQVVSAGNQVAWLDDDGDGAPNETNDGTAAQKRGLSAGAGATQWPPWVAQASAARRGASSGAVRARILDDKGVQAAWAVFYPPSYAPPAPGSEWVEVDLPTVALTAEGNDWFAGTYDGLTEPGTYRVVVYAEDDDGLKGRPVAVSLASGRVWAPWVAMGE